MTFKSQATKEAKERIKNKSKKENNDMSKLAKIKTPLTVIATLAVVAALYSLHIWSYNQGVEHQKDIAAQVYEQVADLKPNQK